MSKRNNIASLDLKYSSAVTSSLVQAEYAIQDSMSAPDFPLPAEFGPPGPFSNHTEFAPAEKRFFRDFREKSSRGGAMGGLSALDA